MTIEYAAVANIICDDLKFPDGTVQLGILGGAGLYAVAGMRIWSESVGVVSGVGDDFASLFGSWFKTNHVDVEGLYPRAAKTPRSWVIYQSDDSRTETPQFGAEHFHLMEPTLNDLPPSYKQARGLYLFRDGNDAYWREAIDWKQTHEGNILWELHAGVADGKQWGHVAEILSQIDLVSLNFSEASQLCNTNRVEDVLDQVLKTGVKGVALRIGSQGSLVANSTSRLHIPIVPVKVADVTGAGNAFSSGFLVGFCQSQGNMVTAGRCGAVSASFMLEQFGPPPVIDFQLQQKAISRFSAVIPTIRG